MKDLANVEKIAQQKGWSRLPLVPPLMPKFERSRAQWQTPNFNVTTQSSLFIKLNLCSVTFRHANVTRDEFFEAITDTIPLALARDFTPRDFRYETYAIIGRDLKLTIGSIDGIVGHASTGTIHLDE